MDESNQPNALHSPFSTLLPEILARIFQYACPILDFNQIYGLPNILDLSLPLQEKRTQFILSAVSSHWRQVVFSTPRIWTSIDLTLSSSTVNRVSAILQTFLIYSGQLPIAIALQFTLSQGHSPDFLVDASCDAVLLRNTHRIHELHLSRIPDVWINLLPSLPNLKKLSIPTRETPSFEPIKSGCLTHLTLSLLFYNPQLSCSDLTVLHLHGMPADVCLEMLLKCPNLIEYRNREPVARALGGWPREPFVLPCLEVFEWPFDNVERVVDQVMLQHIRMPVLRKLVWVDDHLKMTQFRDIFFRNLPRLSLTNFHFIYPRFSSDHLPPVGVFDTICNSFNVERLTLSCVDPLDHFFDRLIPPLNTTGDHQMMTLQKLKSLTIKYNEDFFPTQAIQDKLLQMLQQRSTNMGNPDQEPLRLRLIYQGAFKFKEELKEMNGRGLKVEIFEYPSFY